MRSLLLDVSSWDLITDANNNLAICENPYALAQDAACAIRLFRGELYYNTVAGVPYFQTILGLFPSIEYMKATFEAAARTVPGVVAAKCFIQSIADRKVTGQVQVTDKAGNITAASF